MSGERRMKREKKRRSCPRRERERERWGCGVRNEMMEREVWKPKTKKKKVQKKISSCITVCFQ